MAQIQAAAHEVAARKAWLKSVDDDGLGGRIWVNGHQVGGAGSRFQGFETSHD